MIEIHSMARILRVKVMWIIPSLERPREFDMRAFSAENRGCDEGSEFLPSNVDCLCSS